MGELNRRLDRLEAVATGGRCVVCVDWPATLVDFENDPYGRPSRPPGPDRCPACDWEPYRIEVVYIDDWKANAGLPWPEQAS